MEKLNDPRTGTLLLQDLGKSTEIFERVMLKNQDLVHRVPQVLLSNECRVTRFLFPIYCGSSLVPQPGKLDIEIQSELPRVRSEPDGIDLVFSLVLQPRLDHVLGEHLASEQKLVVFLQGVQRLI